MLPTVEILGVRVGKLVVRVTNLPEQTTLKASHLISARHPSEYLDHVGKDLPPLVEVEPLFMIDPPPEGQWVYLRVVGSNGLDVVMAPTPESWRR